jgi:hypothetical protein
MDGDLKGYSLFIIMNTRINSISTTISKRTKIVREELKNFNEKQTPLSKWIIKDLFDESSLYNPKYNKKLFKNIKQTVKIGVNHQATIPEL